MIIKQSELKEYGVDAINILNDLIIRHHCYVFLNVPVYSVWVSVNGQVYVKTNSWLGNTTRRLGVNETIKIGTIKDE